MDSIEEDIVKDYCLKRPLKRPSVTYVHFFALIFTFTIITFLLLFLCRYLCNKLGNSSYVIGVAFILNCVYFYYLIKRIRYRRLERTNRK